MQPCGPKNFKCDYKPKNEKSKCDHSDDSHHSEEKKEEKKKEEKVKESLKDVIDNKKKEIDDKLLKEILEHMSKFKQ